MIKKKVLKTFTLDDETLDALTFIANHLERSKSSVVRLAIKAMRKKVYDDITESNKNKSIIPSL